MTIRTSGTVAIGRQTPDFTLPSLAGDQVSLSDYLGKRLVLFCWASW